MGRISDTVLMVQPLNFGFNEETAASNSFQQSSTLSATRIARQAMEEFRAFTALLRDQGIDVLEFEDNRIPCTPDAVFPNNWFSTNPSGQLLTFPMATPNRRAERRTDILEQLVKRYRYSVDQSLTVYENEGKYLEGTGSLVIDHRHGVAFAALSPRTHPDILEEYSRKSGNEILGFEASGPAGEPIYHTNVMLCVADEFALVGMETIVPADRNRIEWRLKELGKELILLSNEQVYKHFAGNALQLQNKQKERFLVMSQKARNSLTDIQLKQIEKYGNSILAPALDTIETIGGGSARCMLAEIFKE